MFRYYLIVDGLHLYSAAHSWESAKRIRTFAPHIEGEWLIYDGSN